MHACWPAETQAEAASTNALRRASASVKGAFSHRHLDSTRAPLPPQKKKTERKLKCMGVDFYFSHIEQSFEVGHYASVGLRGESLMPIRSTSHNQYANCYI